MPSTDLTQLRPPKEYADILEVASVFQKNPSLFVAEFVRFATRNKDRFSSDEAIKKLFEKLNQYFSSVEWQSALTAVFEFLGTSNNQSGPHICTAERGTKIEVTESLLLGLRAFDTPLVKSRCHHKLDGESMMTVIKTLMDGVKARDGKHGVDVIAAFAVHNERGTIETLLALFDLLCRDVNRNALPGLPGLQRPRNNSNSNRNRNGYGARSVQSQDPISRNNSNSNSSDRNTNRNGIGNGNGNGDVRLNAIRPSNATMTSPLNYVPRALTPAPRPPIVPPEEVLEAIRSIKASLTTFRLDFPSTMIADFMRERITIRDSEAEGIRLLRIGDTHFRVFDGTLDTPHELGKIGYRVVVEDEKDTVLQEQEKGTHLYIKSTTLYEVLVPETENMFIFYRDSLLKHPFKGLPRTLWGNGHQEMMDQKNQGLYLGGTVSNLFDRLLFNERNGFVDGHTEEALQASITRYINVAEDAISGAYVIDSFLSQFDKEELNTFNNQLNVLLHDLDLLFGVSAAAAAAASPLHLLGGARRAPVPNPHSKVTLKATRRSYVVRYDERRKFILCNRRRVYLSDIRGRYLYT